LPSRLPFAFLQAASDRSSVAIGTDTDPPAILTISFGCASRSSASPSSHAAAIEGEHLVVAQDDVVGEVDDGARAPLGVHALPRDGQRCSSAVPHSSQNAEPTGLSCRQAAQFMERPVAGSWSARRSIVRLA
jgi:hypothetical protein